MAKNPGKRIRGIRREDRHQRSQAMRSAEMREGVREARERAAGGDRSAMRSAAFMRIGGSRRLQRHEKSGRANWRESQHPRRSDGRFKVK